MPTTGSATCISPVRVVVTGTGSCSCSSPGTRCHGHGSTAATSQRDATCGTPAVGVVRIVVTAIIAAVITTTTTFVTVTAAAAAGVAEVEGGAERGGADAGSVVCGGNTGRERRCTVGRAEQHNSDAPVYSDKPSEAMLRAPPR